MTPSILRLRWLVPCVLPAALLAATLAAFAQQPAVRATRADPLDAKAGVPTLTYESSFVQYRPLGDAKPVSWREANDTVARIGGWRVYAREGQEPDAVPVAKPAAPAASTPAGGTSQPMPAGHGGPKTP